jgi:DNA-binding transcriptional regulator YbjK
MLSISGGIVIVLSNDNKVRGVLGHNQFLKAMAESVDATTSTCAEWMEMDFLKVEQKDTLKHVLSEIKKRSHKLLSPLMKTMNSVDTFHQAITKRQAVW